MKIRGSNWWRRRVAGGERVRTRRMENREPGRRVATIQGDLVANGYFRDEMEEARCIRSSLANAVRAFKGSSVADEARENRGAPASGVWRFAVPVENEDSVTDGDPADARAMTRGC